VRRGINGREALDQLGKAETLPDLILLDLMMPVMDGWEFRGAQKSDPALAHIPVVLISAHVDVRSAAAKMEVAAWLKKPIDFGDVLKVVERLAAAALKPERARA
jgi:CheY-like chemotaxis protein